MITAFTLPEFLEPMPEKRVQTLIFFSVFALQYLFEHVFPESKKYNDGRNEIKNVLVGAANLLLLFIPSALLVQLLDIVQKNRIGFLQQLSLPFWLNLLLTILIMDFAMYWWHRFNHEKNIFWRFHNFHHLDKKMNSTTALRFHIVELLFSSFLKGVFYLLMGFSFLPILIYEGLFFIVVVIHHSNIYISTRFDMLYRQVFSSPLMHRIHHSNIQQETDSNYGSVFSFWDRLFGTYKRSAAGPIVFGVKQGVGTSKS